MEDISNASCQRGGYISLFFNHVMCFTIPSLGFLALLDELPVTALKVSVTPKLITQALRMLRLKRRRVRANLSIKLVNQRLHTLSCAGDEAERLWRPGLGEPADGECSYENSERMLTAHVLCRAFEWYDGRLGRKRFTYPSFGSLRSEREDRR